MQRLDLSPGSTSEPRRDLRPTATSGRTGGPAPSLPAPDRRPRAGPIEESSVGEITFPQFEALADDIDHQPGDSPGDALITTPRFSATRPRSRASRRRIVPALLLAVILLQAWPSFIWLRNHFTQRNAQSVTIWLRNHFTHRSAQSVTPVSPSTQTGTVEPDVAPPLPIATTGAADGAPPAPRDVSPDPASPSPGATAGARPAPAVPGRGTGRDGLISLIVPVPAQVFADGKLIGTMDRGVFKLPVGPHDLELVNDELGYRARQRVMVNPARTAQVRLAAPTGTLSINAVPWAEVWIDDTPAGQTPIGDFRAPIGRRRVVLRHPEYGERRFTVLVTLQEGARVSTDFTQR